MREIGTLGSVGIESGRTLDHIHTDVIQIVKHKKKEAIASFFQGIIEAIIGLLFLRTVHF